MTGEIRELAFCFQTRFFDPATTLFGRAFRGGLAGDTGEIAELVFGPRIGRLSDTGTITTFGFGAFAGGCG